MVDLAVQGLGAGELIGGGASSSVFAATRMAFGDRVAVKVLKQTLTDAQSRSHFEREARALAELADIPGVVAVLDSGVNTRGEPYLVLPLFENSAQGDVTAHGAMPPLRAARIVASAARSVHEGHRRGVIHRDLKPANLLLTQSDDTFVSDFGIAKLTDSSVSASGWLGLTPAYAPPEALEGLPAGVLGDVYSLGATLAALVIGAPPFSSTGSESPIALLNRVVNQPAPDLGAFGAPTAIADVVARSMAKDPAQRYSSALELAQALEEALAAPAASTVSDTVIAPTPAGFPSPANPVPPAPVPPPPSATPSPAPPQPAAQYTPPVPAAPVPPPPPAPVPSGPPSLPATPTPPATLASAAAASAPDMAQPVASSAQPPEGKNKVGLIAGAAVAIAAVVGGVVAFGLGGDDTASTPTPTAVVVEDATAEPEPAPTIAPASTATPAPEPTAAPAPTPVPTPAFPAAVPGGPVDVYPDGSGESPNLPAAIARANNGDVIRLAAGTYEIGGTIRVPSDITIIGAGIDKTILLGTTDLSVLVFDSVGGRVRNLTVASSLDSSDENLGLIEVTDSPQLILDNVKVLDSAGFGLTIFGSTVRITNSVFAGSRLSGVGIDSGSNARIASSMAVDNGSNGFIVFDDSVAVFLNNEARDNDQAGYTVEGSGSPEYVSNIAADNGVSGFQFATSSTPVLRGNTSSDNGAAGFAWFENAAGAAIANIAKDNQNSGFSMQGTSSPTLTANTAMTNNEAGFLFAGESTGTAIGNRSDDNQFNGYGVIDTSQPTLRGNIADGNVQGDILDDGSSGVTIDDSGVIRVEVDGSGDTASIESAIAQAGNGDVIRLGPGTHELPTRIVVNKDLTIVGSGPGMTIVSVAANNTVFLVENTPIRLLDMTLTTSYQVETDDERFSVVEIDGATDFTVDNVEIVDSIGIGIGLFASTGAISNSQITNSHWSGIGVSNGAQVLISDVVASGNGQSGVVFFEDAAGTVAGNVADGNTFFGFSVQGAGSPELLGNVSSNNTASGFGHAETASPILIGNVSRGNDEAGYIWFDTTSGQAIANVAEGNGTSGFNISNESSPSLTSNESNRNEIDGFTWFANSSGDAVGNIATGNTLDGFAAEGESSPTLERNASVDNERFNFNQSGEASPTLIDNEFG